MECYRQWRSENRDKLREYNRRANGKRVTTRSDVDRKALWARANREKICESSRLWKAANPDVVRGQAHRRRARLASAVCDLKTAQWDAILDFHSSAEGTRCAYCFGVCQKVTIDHVVPISKGGDHTASNVVPACKSCNSSKGVKEASF
jgi:5-methylcytosine-specific restriction endonuclease McrA